MFKICGEDLCILELLTDGYRISRNLCISQLPLGSTESLNIIHKQSEIMSKASRQTINLLNKGHVCDSEFFIDIRTYYLRHPCDPAGPLMH